MKERKLTKKEKKEWASLFGYTKQKKSKGKIIGITTLSLYDFDNATIKIDENGSDVTIPIKEVECNIIMTDVSFRS